MPGSRRPDGYKPEREVEEASREALRGGVAGAAKVNPPDTRRRLP